SQSDDREELEVSDFVQIATIFHGGLMALSYMSDRMQPVLDIIGKIFELHIHALLGAGHMYFGAGTVIPKPQTLLEFCILDLMGLIARRATVTACRRCGRFFVPHSPGHLACSETCRKATSKNKRRRELNILAAPPNKIMRGSEEIADWY